MGEEFKDDEEQVTVPVLERQPAPESDPAQAEAQVRP